MKFKMKALIALAALGFAGGASAAINTGSAGNGELFLSVWDTKGTGDTADDVSLTFDLGGTAGYGLLGDWTTTATGNTLNPNKIAPPFFTPQQFTNASLTSFIAGASGSANVFWNVAALDSSGARRVLTTSNVTPSGTAGNLIQGITAGQVYLAGVNQTDTDTSLNVAKNFTSADGSAFAGGVSWGGSMGGQMPFSNTANLGESMSFYLLTSGSAATFTPIGVQQFANTIWTLQSDGALVYAPVPEPGTWAMMIAGLLGVGAIARRRLSA